MSSRPCKKLRLPLRARTVQTRVGDVCPCTRESGVWPFLVALMLQTSVPDGAQGRMHSVRMRLALGSLEASWIVKVQIGMLIGN